MDDTAEDITLVGFSAEPRSSFTLDVERAERSALEIARQRNIGEVQLTAIATSDRASAYLQSSAEELGVMVLDSSSFEAYLQE